MTSRSFQRLPLELTLLAGDHLPGFSAQTWGDAVWIVPRESFFAEEHHPHGVWVRGATRSEVIVVSPKPLSRLAFTAYSLSGANVLTLDGGAGRLTVRFDSEGKRGGTPIDLALSPVARDLGFFPAGPRDLLSLHPGHHGRAGARAGRSEEPRSAVSRGVPGFHGRGAVRVRRSPR